MRSTLLAATIVVAVSSAGYMVLGLSPFDAVYMTFITVGTVGFAEVEGFGRDERLWTMAVILMGYFMLVGMTARFTSLLLSGQIRELRDAQRRTKLVSHLHDHLIVVGYGRVGRATVDAAVANGRPCAVIESDPVVMAGIDTRDRRVVPVSGDARDIDVLVSAGIDKAAALVTTLSDPENLVVIASAHITRPDLRIVSRVADTDWSERLTRAGANDLVLVYRSAGQHLAMSAVSAGVVGVVGETDGLATEELQVQPGSPMAGRTAAAIMRDHPDVIVLGVRRDNRLARWHEVEGEISVGDVLIVAGPTKDLRALTP